MLKKIFLILTILLPYSLPAWDTASHIYLSKNMKEIWEDFDPEFYNDLNGTGSIAMTIKKFYYLGTALPDMFDDKAQIAIQDIINALYDVKQDIPEWILDLNYGFEITDETHNQVQTKIEFPNPETDPVPNQNLGIFRQMVEHAKNNGWSSMEKALIYGCYVHCLEDAVAHMILQPATFGYGRSIESPELIDENLLASGEFYQEIFTPTYITDWSWVGDVLFCGITTWGSTRYVFLDLDAVYDQAGRCIAGWQDTDYLSVQKFVEAVNAVEYDVNNLTQERLESYIHGLGLIMFLTMGYKWDRSCEGGVLAHPNWSLSDIASFISDIGDESVTLLDIPVIHEVIGEILEDLFRQTLLELLGYVFEYCTGDESWYTYFESVSGYDQLWYCVPDHLRPPNYEMYRSAIEYHENYSTEMKPHLRSTYSDQLSLGLEFKDFIKYEIDYNDHVWYKWEGKKMWAVARKSGLLGGMYDVDPNYEYYLQPGVFDKHFERDGNLVYTDQDIEIEVPSTIELVYDIIPFGFTRIWIDGKKEDQTWEGLVYDDINQGYDRIKSSLLLNTQEAVNNGYRKTYFDVRTRDKGGTWQFNTMFLSDYEDAFYSESAIYENQLYNTLFNNGNPIRIEGEDPLDKPKEFWPYALLINPVLTELAAPTNLQTEIISDDVELNWVDESSHNEGYELKREDRAEGTEYNWAIYQDVQNDTDYDVDPSHPAYDYWVRAFAQDWQITSSWTGPVIAKFDVTPPNVNVYQPGQYRVVYEGPFTVKWSVSDDFGFGVSSQKLYYPYGSINLDGGVRSEEVNLETEWRGSEEQIKLEAIDHADNTGDDINIAVIIDPSQVNYPLWWSHDANWYITITTEHGKSEQRLFNRVYKGKGNNWSRINISTTNHWKDPNPLSEGQTRNYLVCLNDFDSLSDIITVNRPSNPHPCPVLYSFTGNSFELDNSLIPASGVTHQLTRDYYILREKPEAKDGMYKFKIIEGLDNTYIDLIKLRLIDHSKGLNIGVLPNGDVALFNPSIQPIEAVDNKGKDWKDSLLTKGSGYYHGKKGDYLDVKFDQKGDYLYTILAPPKPPPIEARSESDGSSMLYSRMNGSDNLLSYTDSVIRYLPQDSLCRIDYIRKAKLLPDSPIRELEASPLDLPQEVTEDDGVFYSLLPGDTLEFNFKVSEMHPGFARDYCLEVVGYYLPVVKSKGFESRKAVCESYIRPSSSILTGNLILKTSSNEERKAKVEVIDRIGRIVKREEVQISRGEQKIDLGVLNPGIYFIKVSSNGEEIYKVTVIR